MFKKILLTLSLCLLPSISLAQSFPSRPLDGFWNDAFINSLKQKIDIDRIGIANGVAGLDAHGFIVSPLAAKGSSSINDPDNIPVLVVNPTQGDDTVPGKNYWNVMKPHAVLVGGTRVGTISQNDYGSDSQLYIVGHADGFGGEGCLLCIIEGPGSVTESLPGISSTWGDGPSGPAEYGGADQSIEYIVSGNKPATLTAQVDHYTANSVVLKTALTSDQIARIHYGMYILTNSIDTSIPTPSFSPDSNFPKKNYYGSVVTSVISPTEIAVGGWAVLGNNNSTSGQIPSVTNLDTIWTNFKDSSGNTVPTVGIGANTGSGIFNWRIDHVSRSDSWVHEYGAEYDISNYACDGCARLTGFAIVEGGYKPSADSWAIRLNTPQMPVDLWLDVGSSGKAIYAPGAFLANGSGATETSSPDHVLTETDAFLDSVDNMRLVSYLHRNSGSRGYVSGEMYLGLHANDAFGASPYTATSGAMLGSIGFNVGGNVGSTSLCGGSGTNTLKCTLSVLGTGYMQFTGDVVSTNNITANAFLIKNSSTGTTNMIIDSGGSLTTSNYISSGGFIVTSKITGAITSTLNSDGSAHFTGALSADGGVTLGASDLIHTASTGIASAGSSITDATTITTHYTDVTNTTATSGMKLPTNVVGKSFVVFNRGNADLMIYPDTATSQIESYGAGHPFTLKVNSVVTFVCVGTNQWRIM